MTDFFFNLHTMAISKLRMAQKMFLALTYLVLIILF